MSAPEFLPVRGPVAPFHTPGLGPTSVRLSVVRATGSSPVRRDAAGIAAVFQVERFGDLSWPLAVPYRIDSPLAPGRLVVQGGPPTPAQPILSTRTPFLPMETGVARAEFGVALRFAEGGGATVPVEVVLEPTRAFGVAGSPSASAFLVQSVAERRPWHYCHRWLGAPARGTVTNPEVLEYEVLAAHGDGEVRGASLAWGAQVIRATFEPRGPGGVQRAILRWSEPTVAGWGTLSVTEGDGSVRVLSRQVGLPAQWKATPWVRLATSDPAGLAPTVLQVEAGVSNSLPLSFSLVVDGPAGYRFSSNWFGSPIRLGLPAPVEGDYAARVAVSDVVVSQNLRVHSVPGRAEVTFSTNRVRVRRGEPLELNLERRGDASGTSWVRIRAAGAGGPDVPAPRFEQPAALTNVDYRVVEPVIAFPPGSRRLAVPIQFPLAGMFRGNLGLDLNLELLTNAFPGADRACRVVLLESQELGEARVHLEVLGSVSGLGTRLQARVDGRADLAGQLVLEGWPAGGASTGLASAGRPLLEHTFRPERAGQFFLQARFMDRWQQEHRSPVLAMRLAPELIPGAPQLPGTPPRVWKAVPDYDPRTMDLEASEDLRHWEVVRPIWSPAAPGELRLPDTGTNQFLRLRLP